MPSADAGATLRAVRGRAWIAATVVALLTTGSGLAVASAPRTSFASGTWKGSAPLRGGISRPGIAVSGTGTASFTFTVSRGRVTRGTLTLLVNERGSVNGNAFTGKVAGRLRMAGTAAHPTVSGPVSVTASVLGTSTTVSFPGSGTFDATGTCDRMHGDFAVKARQAQQAAGFATTVTAKFVARRISGSGC